MDTILSTKVGGRGRAGRIFVYLLSAETSHLWPFRLLPDLLMCWRWNRVFMHTNILSQLYPQLPRRPLQPRTHLIAQALNSGMSSCLSLSSIQDYAPVSQAQFLFPSRFFLSPFSLPVCFVECGNLVLFGLQTRLLFAGCLQ